MCRGLCASRAGACAPAMRTSCALVLRGLRAHPYCTARGRSSGRMRARARGPVAPERASPRARKANPPIIHPIKTRLPIARNARQGKLYLPSGYLR